MHIFPDSNWQSDTAIFLGTVSVSWDNQLLARAPWQDIDIKGEVTEISRQPAAAQNQWHLTWVPQASSLHRMAFDVQEYFNTAEIARAIPGENLSWSLIEIPAGRILPWHRDYYNTHVRQRGLSEHEALSVQRAIVCLRPWTFGQIVQIGCEMLHHWRAGDVFTWPHAAFHGAANFGPNPMTFLQITYDNLPTATSP
jgi:hypothetical protein